MIVGVKGAPVFIRNLSARDQKATILISQINSQFSCPEQLFLYYFPRGKPLSPPILSLLKAATWCISRRLKDKYWCIGEDEKSLATLSPDKQAHPLLPGFFDRTGLGSPRHVFRQGL